VKCIWGDYIFRAKLKGVEVQDKNFGEDVTNFTVSGPDGDGYVTLTANSASYSDYIVKTKLKGTEVQAFTPTGGYIYGFSVSGPDADGYVTLTALSTGTKSSGDILRTKLKGTEVQAYPGNTSSSIQGFQISGPDGDGYVYLELGALAVELIGWDCVYQNRMVNVSWETEVEFHNYKWILDRREEGDANYTTIHEEPGHGGIGTNYLFVDSTVLSGRTYWYRLADFDWCDTTWHGEIQVQVPLLRKIPFSLSIYPNPNPCKSAFTITYSVPGILGLGAAEDKSVNLKLYDCMGRLVMTIVDEKEKPGYYRINWDNGLKVKTGVYFVRLEAGKYKGIRKVVLVK
jgi:hypothetical protein